MIVAKAPLRVSLAGGGTDLPSYSGLRTGLVISLAIDRWVCVAAHPGVSDGTARIGFADLEDPGNAESATDADLLQNPFARAVLSRSGAGGGVRIGTFSDVPSGSGLGGSGAFTVAMLHAVRRMDGIGGDDPVSLAEDASAVEMIDLRRPVGKHDHYMAAFGGLRALAFEPEGRVRQTPLPITDRLRSYVADRLLLFSTGVSRDAGRMLAAQDRLTRARGPGVLRRLDSIRALADTLLDELREDRVESIGHVLAEHWLAKSRLSETVSLPRIDELHRLALDSGAEAGKLLGAGGGGFLLFSCRQGEQERLRKAMSAAGSRELEFSIADTGTTAVEFPL
ncbi:MULTISPECIES: GHMP family kinase ATP-binding protein [Nocardiopsidaceae]|uniref:GHMP kinase n=1 Tax=Streptomonospora nanhaiensis TaxID=1323731 RepID=A0ABY6YP47_9ACTN|nr:hypothetical protein [Streptomonospora nanhaiensis]WAE74038.1 hypothetical protein OUQ99_02625 [Streptomonospora nanhaiensis]